MDRQVEIDIAEIKKDLSFIKQKLEERFCEFNGHLNDYAKLRDSVRNNTGFIKDIKEQKTVALQTKWWRVGVIMGGVYFAINLVVFWLIKFLIR